MFQSVPLFSTWTSETPRRDPSKEIRFFAITLFCMIQFLSLGFGQNNADNLLREGAIYDPTRQILYVTQPNERIAAVDVQSGKRLWETAFPGQPINLWEGQLICLVKGNRTENQLVIQQLDPENKGALRRDFRRLRLWFRTILVINRSFPLGDQW